MVEFIDAHRAKYWVESICSQLLIAPSTYCERKAREAALERLPPRARRDEVLKSGIRRAWDEHFQLRRPKCLVTAELRADPCGSLHGGTPDGRTGPAVCGGKVWKTTIPDAAAERLADLVQRQFQANCPRAGPT